MTTIQSCSQGMNKVLVSLQQKFPSVSKSLLKNKVREVSDYVDNRLQVSMGDLAIAAKFYSESHWINSLSTICKCIYINLLTIV